MDSYAYFRIIFKPRGVAFIISVLFSITGTEKHRVKVLVSMTCFCFHGKFSVVYYCTVVLR